MRPGIFPIKRDMPGAKIQGLPVYEAVIPDQECGMMAISLVDDPAVESNFLAFSKVRQMYSIQDEARQIVRGVVMRADFPIYRNQPPQGEFFVIYKPETIRFMAEKYLSESRQNNVNLMHDSDSFVKGVKMIQMFIKDTGAGIVPSGFDDIADGSLFAEFHITDPEIWAEIKAGTYRGFSLEGVFLLEPSSDSERGQTFKKNTMGKKLQELRAKFAALLGLAFGSVTTDKGLLQWDGDEDLKAGDTVYTLDESGERKALPDGDYKTEDGKVIKVAGGKVSEILDKKAEVDAAEDVPNPDGGKETDAEGEEGLRKEVNELYEIVDRILDVLGTNRKDIQKMSADLDALKKRPAAKPAAEEFKNVTKVPKTGNLRLDRLTELLA